MADCEMIERCPFFADMMPDMPQHAELFKELYCRGGNSICARYMVLKALGKDAVPKDLFPNETRRAQSLCETSQKRVRLRA